MAVRYSYDCPRCGLHLDFQKRVTLRRRSCPECGLTITSREIDRQAEVRRRELAEIESANARQTTWAILITVGAISVCAVAVLACCFGSCLFLPFVAPPPTARSGLSRITTP